MEDEKRVVDSELILGQLNLLHEVVTQIALNARRIRLPEATKGTCPAGTGLGEPEDVSRRILVKIRCIHGEAKEAMESLSLFV